MDQRPRTDTTAEDTTYKEHGRQGGALCLGGAYLGVWYTLLSTFVYI